MTSTLQVAECASLTFDRRGRLETVCVGATTPTLKLFDPTTLKQLASYRLPNRRLGLDVFSDFSGGGYFYLDHRDRAVIPTGTNHIRVVGQNRGRHRLRAPTRLRPHRRDGARRQDRLGAAGVDR